MALMSKAARAREINDTIRYTMWSVFRLERPAGDADRVAEGAEVTELFDKLATEDIVVRGTYDMSGVRAEADLMVWWHAATAEQLVTFEGKEKLRKDALDETRRVLTELTHESVVDQVLFTGFVMQ